VEDVKIEFNVIRFGYIGLAYCANEASVWNEVIGTDLVKKLFNQFKHGVAFLFEETDKLELYADGSR